MPHNRVTFFKTFANREQNGPVSFDAPKKLELKSDDRLGFGITKGSGKGRIIYASKRSSPGVAKRAWNHLIGRTSVRKRAAATALVALDIKVKQLPQRPPQLQAQFDHVQAQLAHSGAVRAGDHQTLIDSIDRVEKSHAEQQAKLKFDTELQIVAKLLAKEFRDLSGDLDTPVGPRDEDQVFAGLGAFIEQTVLGGARPDYSGAQPFADAWLARPRQNSTKAPRSGLLMDALAHLVLRGCNSPVVRQQPELPSFSWDGDTLVGADGKKRFIRLDDVQFANGGNGSVKAYQCGNEVVVVKTLHEHDEVSRAETALAEARAHWQANPGGESEHIVGIQGIAVRDGRMMLVLDYAPHGESTDLISKLDSKSPKAEDARMLMFADMLKAAAESHAHGVMHLDLKPGNYFVGDGGKLLLGDFGTSRTTLIEIEKGGIDSVDYTAPELEALGHKEGLITYKADVWSLGVVLYELNSPRQADEEFGATAIRPFPYKYSHEGRESLNQFVQERNRSARFTQLELNEGDPLHELIMKMLDPDPLNRPSLDEVLENPLIQPYAKPENKTEERMVQEARGLIRAQAKAS